ncbi:hypothetical protein H1R20_g11403, partial [Candolleomyces eurysporus]
MEKHATTSWSGTSAFFKWTADSTTGVRVRTRLTKNDVWMEMVKHAPTQRRFDRFTNKWDICTEFGESGGYNVDIYYNNEDEGGKFGDDNYVALMENPGTYTLPEQESPASPPPTPEQYYGWEAALALPGRIGKHIPLLFGLSFTDLPSSLYNFEEHKQLYQAFVGERTAKSSF